ncbi:MAG: Rieske (2Fe-2S) protein [Balneolaceae bacterium]|nr:MAG: Rieske (2Fe-2S) protein [Balneolaceae bacterium]
MSKQIINQSMIENRKEMVEKPYRKEDINRKTFLRQAGSVALFMALGLPFYSCDSTSAADDSSERTVESSAEGITVNGNRITIDLNSSAGQLISEESGWLLIRDQRTLVVNADGNLIRSFTSVCTHAGCSTNWRFQNRQFVCTCHGARFDTGGAVVRGPATRDLPEFTVSREEDQLTIETSNT